MLGCPRTGDGTAGGLDRPARDASGNRVLNVGNPSRGADEQPDYEGLARDVRARVVGRMPAELPPIREACAAMLDAAVTMYERTESDATVLAERMHATRAADLAACEASSSASAAVCVTLLVADDGGEWPWLLDQCMRGFPKG